MARDATEGGRTFTRYSVKVCKRFKGQDGQWQETDSYFPNDLPALRLVSERAYEFIGLKESEEDAAHSAPSR